MKIAVVLDENRNVFDVNNTSEAAAVEQSKKEGWILVEDDPAFLVSERYMWTVRQSDNVLVRISSNQTPEEEKNSVLTKLTLENMSLKSDISDMKRIQTAQTLQNLQDAKDKVDSQKVITNLTMQLMKLSGETITTESTN